MPSYNASKSSASDSRIAATDQAKVAKDKSTLTESGAVALVGKGSSYQAAGSSSFGNNASYSSNVTTADPEVLKAALASNSDLVASALAGNASLAKASMTGAAELAASSLSGNSGLVSSTLNKLSELAESKQTEGVSGLSKTFLWLAGGFAVLVAIYLFRK